MRFHKRGDFWAGLFALVFGLLTAVGSLQYDMGALDRVGPGLYPMGLGVLLTILGILIMVSRDTVQEQIAQETTQITGLLSDRIRLWVAILVGIFLFIILGEYGGLIPATFSVIFVTALGDRSNSLRAAFTLAALSTVAIVLIFHYAIKLQFELIRWG